MMTNEEIDRRIEAWQNGDSNDAEIDGLTEIVRELQAEREHPPFYDPDGDVYYEPFIDGARVGYRVGRTDGRSDAETFLYFNPSTTDGPEDKPNVFVYVGVENDPVHDDPVYFVTMALGRFGI